VNSVVTKPGAIAVTHAAAAELLGERLGEGEHERLARRIDGEVGHRLEGHLPGDVDDAAATPLQHGWNKSAGQRNERFHVQSHEIAFALGRCRGEVAVGCDTGVVHEQFNLALMCRGEQRPDPVSGREIGDQWLEPSTAASDLAGEGAQPLGAPCHRQYRRAARRERKCELAAESRRRAGHHRPTLRKLIPVILGVLHPAPQSLGDAASSPLTIAFVSFEVEARTLPRAGEAGKGFVAKRIS
jgi:hypothetical protein